MVSRIKIFFLSFSTLNLVTFASANITAVFAFGDSTVDPGNNNELNTLARGNHHPYGCNFPGGATGRFSDGKLTADFLVSLLGIKELLPAYLDPKITDHDLLTGLSFASSATGYDDLTAQELNVFTFTNQLEFFDQYLSTIRKTFGTEKSNDIVQNALFFIAAGSNDMVDNLYWLKTRKNFTLSAYHDFILSKLESYIIIMEGKGARKFGVTGLPPIGCLPFLITISRSWTSPQRECNNTQNLDSQEYNTKLQALLSRLQTRFPGSKFGYIDAYNPLMDMIKDPHDYGIEHTLTGCCGSGTFEMGPFCNVKTCKNASQYVFWDAVHPTESTARRLAKHIFETVIPRFVN